MGTLAMCPKYMMSEFTGIYINCLRVWTCGLHFWVVLSLMWVVPLFCLDIVVALTQYCG